MKKDLKSRVIILKTIVMIIFSIFIIKLVEYQIIHGEENFEKSNTSVRFNQTIVAARGDMVDRYGQAIVSSQPVFNVIFNKAYLENDMINTRIVEVLDILYKNNETVNDLLPLTQSPPYTFLQNKSSEIERLRDTLVLNVYATEEDVIKKLVERYSLEDIPTELHRIVGGVRYTMEREWYSLSYPYTIAKDVSIDTVSIVSENLRELMGVEIYETSKRFYEDGQLLSHVIGSVGPIYAEEYAELKNNGYKMNDLLGKDGLEKNYESYLKGTDGIVEIEKNINGEIVKKTITQPPKSGDTLKLTIDMHLQAKLNEILKNQMAVLQTKDEFGGRDVTGLSAVVIDVKTGEVLAISNYPSYDLNDYTKNYSQYASDASNPLFNRALQGLYRPGSAFKASIALAALQNGIIDENTKITCTGRYMHFAPTYTPECAYGRSHGTIDVKEALKVSCNYFFFETGRRLGIENINETAYRLGMGVKTGLEVSEKAGALSSPEHSKSLGMVWQAGDVIQASIGQLNTSVTTAQLATFAATLANSGDRLNTHIIKSITDYSGKTVYETPINVLSKLPQKNDSYRIVEEGMAMASQQGAASAFLSNLPYVIATKTGTAQTSGNQYNATIMSYGPVESPEIAVGIIAEKAGNGYYLAESVREVFLEYYRLKEIRNNPNWQEILYEEKQNKTIDIETAGDINSNPDDESTVNP